MGQHVAAKTGRSEVQIFPNIYHLITHCCMWSSIPSIFPCWSRICPSCLVRLFFHLIQGIHFAARYKREDMQDFWLVEEAGKKVWLVSQSPNWVDQITKALSDSQSLGSYSHSGLLWRSNRKTQKIPSQMKTTMGAVCQRPWDRIYQTVSRTNIQTQPCNSVWSQG